MQNSLYAENVINNLSVVDVIFSKIYLYKFRLRSRLFPIASPINLELKDKNQYDIIKVYMQNQEHKQLEHFICHIFPHAKEFYKLHACNTTELKTLFTLDRYQESLLILAKTPEETIRLLEQAHKLNCFSEFLTLKNKQHVDVLIHYIKNERIECAEKLVVFCNEKYPNDFSKFFNMHEACHHARKMAFININFRDKYNALIKDHLRNKLTFSYFEKFENSLPNISIEVAYNHFFKPRQKKLLKTMSADEIMMMQALVLLTNVEACVPYLQMLDKDLQNYYKKKQKNNFPILDKNQYKFEKINDLDYPVPVHDYKGISKNHALSECLIEYFRKYDLAKNIYKWQGYIPNDKADEMFAAGDFITESRLGMGLFHGKLSHMIQMYILIKAIEEKKISNVKSIKQFFKIMSTLKIEGILARLRVVDTRLNDMITFSDPYRIYSVIMRFGDQLNIPTLASSLIDSGCKGFIKLRILFNEVLSMELTNDELALQLNDLILHYFTTLDLIYSHSKNEKILTNFTRKNLLEKSERYSIFHLITDKNNNAQYVSKRFTK